MAATRPSGQTVRRAGLAPGAREPRLPNGRRVPAPIAIGPAPQSGATRTIRGSVRAGRRTKLLVKHLARGEIALVDHLDIDRVSAEELIAAGAAAVLNCSASSSGTYPNLGPQLLVESGILLVDLPDDALFEEVSEGDELVVAASHAPGARPAEVLPGLPAAGASVGEVLRGGELLAHGEVLDFERVRAETDARRREI